MERAAFRSRVRDDPEAGRSGRPQTQLFDRSTSWPIRHPVPSLPKSLPVSLPLAVYSTGQWVGARSSPTVSRVGNGGSRLRNRAFGAPALIEFAVPGPTRSMHRAERVRRGASAAFTSNAWRPDLDRRAHQPARCRSSRCRCFWASRRSRIGGPHARTLLVAMVDRVCGRDWSRQEPVFDATVASRDRCSP